MKATINHNTYEITVDPAAACNEAAQLNINGKMFGFIKPNGTLCIFGEGPINKVWVSRAFPTEYVGQDPTLAATRIDSGDHYEEVP
ncbi:MAG: hypothetical protein M0Q91_12720 [Methanoregula sp.]|jgi:hypothetical protein|nr:hypothetical protein [Methanoregula sp.]